MGKSGKTPYVDSKDELLVKRILSAYDIHKANLILWIASFTKYSTEVLKHVQECDENNVCRLKKLLSDWSRFYLDINDFLIVLNYGVCIRSSHSVLFKDFISNNFGKDCDASDDNYCEGMKDYDYSLCSNYGLTRFIDYLDRKFAGKLKNLDTITCNFVNIDEAFSDVRRDLNSILKEFKSVITSLSFVKSFKFNGLIVEKIAAEDFSMCIEFTDMKNKPATYNYHGRVNDTSVPKMYHIYNKSGTSVLYEREILSQEPSSAAKKSSSGRLVKSSGKLLEKPSVVSQSCGEEGGGRKRRIISASPTECTPAMMIAGPVAVVSYEKASQEPPQLPNDSHTARLISTVMSPETSVFKSLQETTSMVQDAAPPISHDIQQEMVQKKDADLSAYQQDNGSYACILGDSNYDKEQQDRNNDDITYRSEEDQEENEADQEEYEEDQEENEADQEENEEDQEEYEEDQEENEEDQEEYVEDQKEEETQQQDDETHIAAEQDTFDYYNLNDNEQDEQDDFNCKENAPNSFKDCTVLNRCPIEDQEEFDDEIFQLVVDKIGHEVKLETFVVNYLLSRNTDAEVDWFVYHKQLEKRVLKHFRLDGSENGHNQQIVSSKCRKSTPKEERTSMSREQYVGNGSLMRRIRRVTRNVIRTIVAVARLTKNRGAGSKCQVVPKTCAKLFEVVRSSDTLQRAFAQSKEESLSLIERTLDAGRQNHLKLPKSIEAAQELEKIRALSLETSPPSSNKLNYAGAHFGGMDDDSQVEKDYADRPRKRAKIEGIDMSQSAVLSSATPLRTPQSSVWNTPIDDSSPASDDGGGFKSNHNASRDTSSFESGTPVDNDISSTIDDLNTAKRALSELCKPTQINVVNGDKEIVVYHVDFSWGIDIFLSEVFGSIANHDGNKYIALVMSISVVDKWKQAVWNARQLCSAYDTDLENDTPYLRLNIMRLLAHTSIEDILVKGVLFPILAKFHSNVVIGKKITLLYCSNPEQKFRIVNYNIGSVDGGVEGLFDVRIVANSFSFFHTSDYLAKLTSKMAKKTASVAGTPATTPQ